MSFAMTNKRNGDSKNTIGRKRLALIAAAATGLAGFASHASAQATLTWTGAVNNTWDAVTDSFAGTLNWTNGAPTVYSHRGNAVFTDNFAGPVNIDVGTISSTQGATVNSVGMDPTSLTFR